ncbi:D-glycerate dehydrogenase [Mesobacterium sp. TK19101]|uniref:D-glycerate dehydrogenase n=1 Tax=Mesobacterium hydrothermale TaxID=3111907 RepID=A0ABU6HP03_9RHOB|nr:D-glycerate dehydrogenase [Mesobacterium sp. TK19101]MEC3863183.1 D-glycerate dehydrogenase [Mesobacterium sp. TK19101]
MLKLLVTRNLPDRVIDALRDGFDLTYRDSPDVMTRDEMIASLRDHDAVLPTLGDLYSADVFEAAGEIRTRLLANFGVGFNHIDVAVARSQGITVTNTPGAVTDATADIALMLMLMSCRRAAEGERLVRSGTWRGWHPVQMLGQHMSGKTVGIVGMGRIGQAIARRAHFGFGMPVLFYNRSPRTVDFPAEQVGRLTDLAAESDVLVAAVPGGGANRHLIDANVFAAMKPSAHFVNIARGDVVDEPALIAALQTGQIAGAGLDVYEHEPHVPDALIALQNVTLLPHLGTAALEVREDMGMMAVANIRAFFAGEPVPNPV